MLIVLVTDRAGDDLAVIVVVVRLLRRAGGCRRAGIGGIVSNRCQSRHWAARLRQALDPGPASTGAGEAPSAG